MDTCVSSYLKHSILAEGRVNRSLRARSAAAVAQQHGWLPASLPAMSACRRISHSPQARSIL